MLLISCLKYRLHEELLWHRSLSGKTNWGEMAQLRNSLYFSISNGKVCNNLCPVGRVCRLRKGPHYFLSCQAVQLMQSSVLGCPQNQMLCRERVLCKASKKSTAHSQLLQLMTSFCWHVHAYPCNWKHCGHHCFTLQMRMISRSAPLQLSKSFKHYFSVSSTTENLRVYQVIFP